jgi:putative RecB family exonuclease
VTTPAKPAYRSVSQLNQYERCPHSYYLSRVLKAWQRPAAWLAQGSAVHEAAEYWERSGRTATLEEVQEHYTESYERHINEALATTPNFQFWFASGPYRGEEDTSRRYLIGLEQVEKYLAWYAKWPEQAIWIAPDGTPGIEIGFDIELDGIPIRGFIDAVIQIPGYAGSAQPEVIVRDNKTGNSPGDDFQLGVYGVALAEQFGIDPPQRGDYWMGRSGKATIPYEIGEWTREKVSAKFQELEANLQAERFDPKPEASKCRFCDVALACEFRIG